MTNRSYKALVSSDWNQCLAPCGPFDPILFSYPQLSAEVTALFTDYTGNRISLGAAAKVLASLLPAPLSIDQMDAYLDASFETYAGVAELMHWCRQHDVLFMINTTGLMGYFQRVFAKELLPGVPVLSANAMLRFAAAPSDPETLLPLVEIEDKGKHTERVLRSMGAAVRACILIGDSGGDGPHFEWGARHGAFLVASMPKPSLLTYCRNKGIAIDLRLGSAAGRGCESDAVDFSALIPVLGDLI